MPIYEYQCKSCHHHFDLMQKISDAPITQCPECTKQAVIKLVSAAGFQLKGTGWYATDFKNKTHGSCSATPESNKTENKTENKTKESCSGSGSSSASSDSTQGSGQ